MFQRRQKLSFITRVLQFIWPSAGWSRSSKYVFHRVARIPGSAYSLAAGFACGAAISFTPFIGLHFVLSAILAYVIRANVVASAIGTAIGNPWTFPFIWVGVYKVGSWLTMADGAKAHEVDFLDVLTESMEATHRLDWAYLGDIAWPVLMPMLVGSVPVGIFVWILFYFPLHPIISKYQAARKRRRLSNVNKV